MRLKSSWGFQRLDQQGKACPHTPREALLPASSGDRMSTPGHKHPSHGARSSRLVSKIGLSRVESDTETQKHHLFSSIIQS